MIEFGTLLVVGSNPPAQTSGVRTLTRVEQAATLLGFERGVIANLFALPSYRSGGISELGQSPSGWLEARAPLISGLDDCQGVVLAYGTQEPKGEARAHHREQVRWLKDEIKHRELPTWCVGGAPRHPSRWHRHTWRESPGVEFSVALKASLSRCSENDPT